MPEEYPNVKDAVQLLRMLVASVEKLQAEMGGTEATKNCTGLLTAWDSRNPTFFYLERNLNWAKDILSRLPEND